MMCYYILLHFNCSYLIINFFIYFRGLLSGHIFAQHFKENSNHLQWYNGELLAMAKDLGYRLMPAFNTTTGIPYSRVRTNQLK